MTGKKKIRKLALFALILGGAVFCALVCGCTATDDASTDQGFYPADTPGADVPSYPPNGTMQGHPMDEGPGSPDLATAAASLGVTEDALREALGEPQEGQMDLDEAAAHLGVTVEELQEALGTPPDDRRPPVQ